MIDVSVVLQFLRPNAQWSLGDSCDYDSLVWLSTDSVCPTRNEVEAAWPDAKKSHYLSRIRLERNALLAESDWTQAADAPVDADAWAAYRQQLRDLPATIEDPTQPVEWPAPPA